MWHDMAWQHVGARYSSQYDKRPLMVTKTSGSSTVQCFYSLASSLFSVLKFVFVFLLTISVQLLILYCPNQQL